MDTIDMVVRDDGAEVAQARGQELEPITVSAATSSAAVSALLVNLDPQRVLAPRFHCFCGSSVETASGDYDFAGLERSLRWEVRSASRIQVQLRHYRFAGEVRSSGRLALLRAKLPQEGMPAGAAESLQREIARRGPGAPVRLRAVGKPEDLVPGLADCVEVVPLAGPVLGAGARPRWRRRTRGRGPRVQAAFGRARGRRLAGGLARPGRGARRLAPGAARPSHRAVDHGPLASRRTFTRFLGIRRWRRRARVFPSQLAFAACLGDAP